MLIFRLFFRDTLTIGPLPIGKVSRRGKEPRPVEVGTLQSTDLSG